MPTLDSQIDELYAGPLESFVSSRNALAASLSGADRARVKSLQKPHTLAWLVNQTYWHARETYDRLLKAGAQLRAVQVGALEGKSSDVRAALLRQRDAVARAIAAAVTLGEREDVRADKDRLRVFFDALSARENLPEPHGRLTAPIQPAGFESLAGFSFPGRPPETARPTRASQQSARQNERERRREEAEERKRAEEQRRLDAAIKKAEASVEALRQSEESARRALEQATQARERAERDLAKLRE